MGAFDGKNIIVTGGASGIGLAITLTLAERGATVWTVDLSKEPAAELRSWIEEGKVHFEGGVDVADRETTRKYISNVVSKAGRLDGLVNNAGIGMLEGPIASDEAFDRMNAVNYGGTWFYGTAALRAMQQQEPKGSFNSRGSIVNIASGAGTRGVQGLACYCATKHAVIGLARAWAQDFGQFGIRINAIAPGITATPAFEKRVRDEEGFLESMPPNPLKRFGKPSEIASAVAFLLSDEASYVNGEVLPVSGGVI